MAVVTTAEAGRRAVELGATIIQLRAPDATAHQMEEMARSLATSKVPVLISSRCDIALAARVAGVNLPENDIPVAYARRLFGSEGLVGRSVHSSNAAREAARQGADYVIFGPVWTNPTHPGVAGQGVDALAKVVRSVKIPVLAIGGLTRERIAACLEAGAAGYAAIRLFE